MISFYEQNENLKQIISGSATLKVAAPSKDDDTVSLISIIESMAIGSENSDETVITHNNNKNQGDEDISEQQQKKNLSSIDLKCDRGGAYRERRTGPAIRRGTGTRLVGCPSKWKIVKRQHRWILKTQCNNHNHQLDTNLSDHPSMRRLTDSQQGRVAQMTAGGSLLRQIISTLRQAYPDTLLTPRTICNEHVKIRKTQLDGRTPIGALVDELS
ncbi:hypothetical protein BC941DRAFT_476490 [Chlamydoabsidia padenii]|nr:hypothetical protein BC941DRAFT_476490 [Chlamydoabsidia padenii]